MNIKDVLEGNENVIVKTDRKDYEFSKKDNRILHYKGDKSDIPNKVKEVLEEKEFNLDPEFPITVNHYAHDEAMSYDYEDISEQANLPADHEIVNKIAGLSYEIEFTVDIIDESTCELTHIKGHELKEPYKI